MDGIDSPADPLGEDDEAVDLMDSGCAFEESMVFEVVAEFVPDFGVVAALDSDGMNDCGLGCSNRMHEFSAPFMLVLRLNKRHGFGCG